MDPAVGFAGITMIQIQRSGRKLFLFYIRILRSVPLSRILHPDPFRILLRERYRALKEYR